MRTCSPSSPTGWSRCPRTGQVTLPTTEFLATVAEFDRALLTAMAARIDELEQRGPVPGIALGLAQLRREHQDRTTWLARARNRAPHTDWDAVRLGVRILLPDGPARAR